MRLGNASVDEGDIFGKLNVAFDGVLGCLCGSGIPLPPALLLLLLLLLPVVAGVIANNDKLVQLLLADISGVVFVDNPRTGELGKV